MQKQNQKLILLLIILSSVIGCKKDFPQINPQLRCVNVLEKEVEIDGEKFYSGHCRCHLYEWNIQNIGRVGESGNFELKKCDKLIGFEPDTWVVVWTWWENIRLWLIRNS